MPATLDGGGGRRSVVFTGGTFSFGTFVFVTEYLTLFLSVTIVWGACVLGTVTGDFEELSKLLFIVDRIVATSEYLCVGCFVVLKTSGTVQWATLFNSIPNRCGLPSLEQCSPASFNRIFLSDKTVPTKHS